MPKKPKIENAPKSQQKIWACVCKSGEKRKGRRMIVAVYGKNSSRASVFPRGLGKVAGCVRKRKYATLTHHPARGSEEERYKFAHLQWKHEKLVTKTVSFSIIARRLVFESNACVCVNLPHTAALWARERLSHYWILALLLAISEGAGDKKKGKLSWQQHNNFWIRKTCNASERRRRKCGRNIRSRTGLKRSEVDPIQWQRTTGKKTGSSCSCNFLFNVKLHRRRAQSV